MKTINILNALSFFILFITLLFWAITPQDFSATTFSVLFGVCIVLSSLEIYGGKNKLFGKRFSKSLNKNYWVQSISGILFLVGIFLIFVLDGEKFLHENDSFKVLKYLIGSLGCIKFFWGILFIIFRYSEEYSEEMNPVEKKETKKTIFPADAYEIGHRP